MDGLNEDIEQPLLSKEEQILDQHGSTSVLGVTEAVPVAQQILRAELSDDDPLPVEAERRDDSGRWRDGLCDCCVHCCCHPSYVCPYYCPLIAIGQVMGRFNLNILGRRGTNLQSTLTFFLLCTVTALLIFLGLLGVNLGSEKDPNDSDSPYVYLYSILSSAVIFLLYYLIVITRRYIKRRDRIPDGCCGGLDDCCVAAFFPFCTISQMMRHTANYRTYRAVWFSQTGLPSGLGCDGNSESRRVRVDS